MFKEACKEFFIALIVLYKYYQKLNFLDKGMNNKIDQCICAMNVLDLQVSTGTDS